MIEDFVLKRENLMCLFVLLDARLEPQANDLNFIQWAGSKEVPLALIFTKIDKLKRNELQKNMKQYEKTLLTQWEILPTIMLTSSVDKNGREELLTFVENAIKNTSYDG